MRHEPDATVALAHAHVRVLQIRSFPAFQLKHGIDGDHLDEENEAGVQETSTQYNDTNVVNVPSRNCPLNDEQLAQLAELVTPSVYKEDDPLGFHMYEEVLTFVQLKLNLQNAGTSS